MISLVDVYFMRLGQVPPDMPRMQARRRGRSGELVVHELRAESHDQCKLVFNLCLPIGLDYLVCGCYSVTFLHGPPVFD